MNLALSLEPAGKVYLVGAGPGAADLLTLRAARLLEQADILFHDALVNPEIIALATRAEKVAVGKRCGRHSAAQRFINKRLVDAAPISMRGASASRRKSMRSTRQASGTKWSRVLPQHLRPVRTSASP